MIQLIVLVIVMFYILGIYCEAAWDSEAFKTGKSNHTYKTLFLTFYIGSGGLLGLVGYLLPYEWQSLLKMLLIGLCYPSARRTFFDLFLNILRGKPDDYKTVPMYVKWLSCLFMIGCITLIFIL